jgi:hypothetical protein
LLCGIHHRQLLVYLKIFETAPRHWTALSPRNWAPRFQGSHLLGAHGTLRFLVSRHGEPLALGERGLIGVDSGDESEAGLVVERQNMSWLLRLGRADVQRALEAAAALRVGDWFEGHCAAEVASGRR